MELVARRDVIVAAETALWSGSIDWSCGRILFLLVKKDLRVEVDLVKPDLKKEEEDEPTLDLIHARDMFVLRAILLHAEAILHTFKASHKQL